MPNYQERSKRKQRKNFHHLYWRDGEPYCPTERSSLSVKPEAVFRAKGLLDTQGIEVSSEVCRQKEEWGRGIGKTIS